MDLSLKGIHLGEIQLLTVHVSEQLRGLYRQELKHLLNSIYQKHK